MKIPMDISKPLWKVHLLDLKTSEAENITVWKIHHSVGDGMSIMSLVLACMRKTANPDELPSLPYQNRSSSHGSSRLINGSRANSRLRWFGMVILTTIILAFNTVCDGLEFIVTMLFFKDTETPIKGGDSRSMSTKRLRLVHRTVSLDDIKLIKNAMNMVAATILNRLLSNTTMTFSNIVGPVEEISFDGHPITYIASSVYGHPHALTMHCQNYMNKMTITLIVDPTVICDPHRLCDDLEESLQTIKGAVQERKSAQLDKME